MARKKNFKKTKAEEREYKRFLKSSDYLPGSTITVKNQMLQGSDDWESNNGDINFEDQIRKTPLKYRALDWLKANIFPTVVTTIVIAIGTAVIANHTSIALINQKIDYLEKQIEEIQDNTIDKEVLELKLNEIENKLDSSYGLKLNDIKWKLEQLEDKLENIS